MVKYVERAIRPKFELLLSYFPVVALLGVRQVGKTSFVKNYLTQHPSDYVYLDLERPGDLYKLADPVEYFDVHQDKCVIIDEVQRNAELFPALRGIIDNDRRPGKIILLGSASPSLLRDSGESLAGRIAYLELTGLTALELASTDVSPSTRWLRGGFPDSVLAPNDVLSWSWRDSFITTYIHKELPELGLRVDARTLRNFWRMLAHSNGQLLNYERLANSLGVTSKTVKGYLSFFERSYLIRQLPPYHVNLKKRLVKSSKVYIRDTGILHHLLSIQSYGDLLGRPEKGGSYEALAIEQICSALPTTATPYFFRTHQGAEIDLVIELNGKLWAAVEIKANSAPKLSKGFYLSCDELKIDRRFLVAPVDSSYPTKHGVIVLDIASLLEILQEIQ